MTVSEPPFVGPHVQIVDDLVDRLERIAQGDQSVHRVVVLKSHSGTGKSRIVREFYARLQERQPEPTFWPALPSVITNSDGVTNPLATRKVLGPKLDELIWPADALPSFGWWSFECQRGNTGMGVDLIPKARQDLKTLLLPMAMAKADITSIWDKVSGKRDAVIYKAREAFTDEVVDDTLETLQEALNIAIPGVGTLVKWGWEAKKSVEEYAQNQLDLSSTIDLSAQAAKTVDEAAKELAERFLSLSHKKLPWVVAVEDAHAMGQEMGKFLNELARPNQTQPVLTILTTWPEGELHPTWQSWLDEAQQLDRVTIIDVPEMGTGNLLQILKNYAPGVSETDATKIVDSMTSPLMLTMWLTTEAVQRRIRRFDGALPLNSDSIKIPSSLEEIYLQRWKELSPNVQNALAAAVALSNKDNPVPSFLPDVVAKAAQILELDSVEEGLELANDPAAWTILQGIVHSFREEKLADLARNADIIDSYDANELCKSAVEILRARIEKLREGYTLEPSQESSSAAVWLLELVETPTSHPSDITAAWHHAQILAAYYQYAPAIGLLAQAIQNADSSEPELFIMRGSLANWFGQSGHIDEAVAQSRELLNDQARILGHHHRYTLTTRNDLATWLGEAGNAKEAVTMLGQLLDDSLEVLGRNHLDTFRNRSNFAGWLCKTGNIKEGVEQLRQLLVDSLRSLGTKHPSTLTTRNALAYWLGEIGEVEDAINQFRELLPDVKQTFGLDHYFTLRVRGNLASNLGKSGQIGEAITMYHSLLADDLRILGSEHPDTLTTRSNIAYWLGEFQNTKEAITEHKLLLADQYRILGPDHLDTLKTRNNLAYQLTKAKRFNEAIDQLRMLLESQTRTLGPEHSDTLTTCNSIANLFVKADLFDEAINQFSQLLSSQIRSLGVDHSNTLTTRNISAKLLIETRRFDEAINQFRALLESQIRKLGPDHPEILATRDALVQSFYQAGQIDEAIKQLKQLFDTQNQILGPDHPDTLKNRGNLAVLFEESGQISEAITRFRKLLTDRIQLLGPEHPDVLTTHSNLIRCLIQSGQLDESVNQLWELHDAQVRVLDANDPLLLATRSNLAVLLGETGKLKEALFEFHKLLNDHLQLFGPEHSNVLTARTNLVKYLFQDGQIDEAINQLRQLCDAQIRVLGPNHRETLLTRNNLACMLAEAGQTNEAIAELRQLLEEETQVLGLNHPDTVITRNNLECLLDDQT